MREPQGAQRARVPWNHAKDVEAGGAGAKDYGVRAGGGSRPSVVPMRMEAA